MIKLEKFNKDALHSKVNEYFTIVVNDCNNIKDIRFLILRFCIACEKVIDDVLFQFIQKNDLEIDEVLQIQLVKYKIGNQNCLIKLNTEYMSFAQKVATMKAICDFKNVDVKYLDFLDFLRDARNIVGHQLIEEKDIISYLNANKDRFIFSFVREDMKPLFLSQFQDNNYHEILKGLLPLISIELNELQRKVVNFSSQNAPR
jgi:hypothetical protein